jgi:L-asparaginase II
VDAVHRGDLAVVSLDGELLAAVGEPHRKVAYWRSSAKPFQAMPLLATRAGRALGLSGEEIALISSSHGGEPVHVELVGSLLEHTGHRIGELACGVHAPLDRAAADALLRRGEHPTALHHNCSGKHAGMLALADALGVPSAGYRAPAHPVQQAVLETVAQFTGLGPDTIQLGLDGCGVPSFGITVYRMALAYARLMQPSPDIPGALRDAAERVRDAMMAHPYLVAGHEQLDTVLMQALPGAVLSKSGAGGIQCMGLPGGIGLAVKIEDGAGSAAPGGPAGVAALAALRALGVLDDAVWTTLEPHAQPAVRTVAGELAGTVRATFELERPASGS